MVINSMLITIHEEIILNTPLVPKSRRKKRNEDRGKDRPKVAPGIDAVYIASVDRSFTMDGLSTSTKRPAIRIMTITPYIPASVDPVRSFKIPMK